MSTFLLDPSSCIYQKRREKKTHTTSQAYPSPPRAPRGWPGPARARRGEGRPNHPSHMSRADAHNKRIDHTFSMANPPITRTNPTHATGANHSRYMHSRRSAHTPKLPSPRTLSARDRSRHHACLPLSNRCMAVRQRDVSMSVPGRRRAHSPRQPNPPPAG